MLSRPDLKSNVAASPTSTASLPAVPIRAVPIQAAPAPAVSPRAGFDPLDRTAIGYLMLPLVIFAAGWFEWWAAVPMCVCVAWVLRPLLAALPAGAERRRITRLQLAAAVAVGAAWTLCGGGDHLMFANADWHIRDAVLHDLVVSPWPVGYGPLDGKQTLLRAPLGFYLPAALVGKWLGLASAHAAMALWTALGASLFLLQVLTLVPARAGVIALTCAVIVLFSGFDIIGNLINTGPRFVAYWNIAQHLEWWAGTYQYSSMTTQLFWVPNHALGGWLMVGLLARNARFCALDATLPILLVSAALWSPLSALGLVPFVGLRLYRQIAERQWGELHPRVWVPGLVVGLPVAAYLLLDPGGIPKGLSVGAGSATDTVLQVLNQLQFFLLEAGFIGMAVWSIRRSADLALALIVLALLPAVHFGPYNDLVMRGSIPALAVLAIGACAALASDDAQPHLKRKKIVLLCLLAVGSVTAVQEFARAFILKAWPFNTEATLIGASCGSFQPHYTARLGGEIVARLLRPPYPLGRGTINLQNCRNPAVTIILEENRQ